MEVGQVEEVPRTPGSACSRAAGCHAETVAKASCPTSKDRLPERGVSGICWVLETRPMGSVWGAYRGLLEELGMCCPS